MNNGPFFRNYSNQQPSRPIRSMPIYQTQPKPSPKVISVPVHFVSSHQSPRTPLLNSKASSAAIKIQTLFRGFLVRKSLKKIASIRTEVREIERRIDDDIEVAELIRRDAKERLKVNETLMSLLFKLDSIRGFDFGVREFRKAVTRKAIALQEKIDSIANPNPNQTLDSPPNKDCAKIEPDNDACTSTSSEQVTETSDSIANDANEDRKEDHHHEASMEDGGDGGEDGKSREVIAKLVADNEKMMKLMMEISERNEMHTRMINALSRKVEKLEKAFATENIKRKKKTRAASRKRDCIDA